MCFLKYFILVCCIHFCELFDRNLLFFSYIFLFFVCLVMSFYLFFFFFSSRRRHTRSYGDWSSDVCSSDLKGKLIPAFGDIELKDITIEVLQSYVVNLLGSGLSAKYVRNIISTMSAMWDVRSEERRVGKECRSRRRAKQINKEDRIWRRAG